MLASAAFFAQVLGAAHSSQVTAEAPQSRYQFSIQGPLAVRLLTFRPAMAKDVESLAGLQQLFQELQIPEIPECFVEALQTSNIASIADFAYAYPSAADLSVFAQARSEDFWQALQVADPEHSMPMARMRRALTRAQALAKVQDELPAYAQQAPPVPYPAEGQQSVRANVWAEHAPPRLDASTVTQLQASFRSNYPGEHLDADCMASIRLLSLVHMWFKPGGTIKWVPWQMRLSSKQYQDIIEARTSRTLRTEAQLISAALFDETPELPVEHVRLNASWLAGKQTVFRNAIALCNGAHLAVLKALDKKVLDLCAQAMPASSGLRARTPAGRPRPVERDSQVGVRGLDSGRGLA